MHRHQRSAWRRSLGRGPTVALAIAALSAVAFAPGSAGAATAPRTANEVATAKDAKFGTILVAEDNTVYTLKPSKAACTAKCLKAWPPVVLPAGMTAATAGPGVDAAKLGAKARTDGTMQVTYNGKALYWFFKDKAPGQVKGNVTDKWGKWLAVVTVPGKSKPKSAGTGGISF
jgi:predicted lipoprotein with Yx(FWY)xxD motif